MWGKSPGTTAFCHSPCTQQEMLLGPKFRPETEQDPKPCGTGCVCPGAWYQPEPGALREDMPGPVAPWARQCHPYSGWYDVAHRPPSLTLGHHLQCHLPQLVSPYLKAATCLQGLEEPLGGPHCTPTCPACTDPCSLHKPQCWEFLPLNALVPTTPAWRGS